MTMSGRLLPTFVFVATLLAMTVPSAAQYSSAVKGACKNDYKRFCGAYALEDPGLRKCMDKAGPSLSNNCVVTLVNTGEVSYQRATQRWGHKLQKVE
jgi:hypothetical protein